MQNHAAIRIAVLITSLSLSSALTLHLRLWSVHHDHVQKQKQNLKMWLDKMSNYHPRQNLVGMVVEYVFDKALLYCQDLLEQRSQKRLRFVT